MCDQHLAEYCGRFDRKEGTSCAILGLATRARRWDPTDETTRMKFKKIRSSARLHDTHWLATVSHKWDSRTLCGEEPFLFSFPMHPEPTRGPIAHTCNTAHAASNSSSKSDDIRRGLCPVTKTHSRTTSLDVVVMPNCPKSLHFPTRLVADQLQFSK